MSNHVQGGNESAFVINEAELDMDGDVFSVIAFNPAGYQISNDVVLNVDLADSWVSPPSYILNASNELLLTPPGPDYFHLGGMSAHICGLSHGHRYHRPKKTQRAQKHHVQQGHIWHRQSTVPDFQDVGPA